MGMSYDVALITTADEVAKLTGVQFLDNLDSSEFTVAEGLIEAHRFIFRAVRKRFGDPTKLTNEGQLKRAVAFEAIQALDKAGLIRGVNGGSLEQDYKRDVERELAEFTPEFLSGDSVPTEGKPSFMHFPDPCRRAQNEPFRRGGAPRFL